MLPFWRNLPSIVIVFVVVAVNKGFPEAGSGDIEPMPSSALSHTMADSIFLFFPTVPVAEFVFSPSCWLTNRLSWQFWESSLVFSCSNWYMYSAVCCRIAAYKKKRMKINHMNRTHHNLSDEKQEKVNGNDSHPLLSDAKKGTKKEDVTRQISRDGIYSKNIKKLLEWEIDWFKLYR